MYCTIVWTTDSCRFASRNVTVMARTTFRSTFFLATTTRIATLVRCAVVRVIHSHSIAVWCIAVMCRAVHRILFFLTSTTGITAFVLDAVRSFFSREFAIWLCAVMTVTVLVSVTIYPVWAEQTFTTWTITTIADSRVFATIRTLFLFWSIILWQCIWRISVWR